MTTSMHNITTSNLTEEQQAAFMVGWEAAGGYTDDCEDSPAPWCCPWCYQRSITVTGDTPEEWGASWWQQCREEVETLMREEVE